MKTIRVKVRCTHAWTSPPYTASFHPVGGSPENEQFFDATPGGVLSLAVMREQHFEAGKEYYLDLTPAD